MLQDQVFHAHLKVIRYSDIHTAGIFILQRNGQQAEKTCDMSHTSTNMSDLFCESQALNVKNLLVQARSISLAWPLNFHAKIDNL